MRAHTSCPPPHTLTHTTTTTTTTTSYYNTAMITTTSIEAGLQAGATCSMLGLQTSDKVKFKAGSQTGITGKIGVWVRGEMEMICARRARLPVPHCPPPCSPS